MSNTSWSSFLLDYPYDSLNINYLGVMPNIVILLPLEKHTGNKQIRPGG